MLTTLDNIMNNCLPNENRSKMVKSVLFPILPLFVFYIHFKFQENQSMHSDIIYCLMFGTLHIVC